MINKTMADALLNQGRSQLMRDTARAYDKMDIHQAAEELDELAMIFRHRALRLQKGIEDMVQSVTDSIIQGIRGR